MTENESYQISQDNIEKKIVVKFNDKVWEEGKIPTGIYNKPKQTIQKAIQNVVLAMVKKLPSLKKSHKILIIGSGFGGVARFIAQKYGCKVDCLNLNESENNRNKAKVKLADLEKLITITTGNFEDIPFDRETYDIVWSQDALLNSIDKKKAFREVTMVLKPEGRFIFTETLQSEDCPEGALKMILDGLQIDQMESINSYNKLARRVGLERVFAKQMPEQLVNHYSAVLLTLKDQYDKVVNKSNEAFIKKRMIDLQRCIDASQKGYLNWGILQFQKRNI